MTIFPQERVLLGTGGLVSVRQYPAENTGRQGEKREESRR